MLQDTEFVPDYGEQLYCDYATGQHLWSQYELLAPLSAFCVTLYNEKRASVEATLRSITAAVSYCRRHDPNLRGTSVVCLIADGRAALDPELLTWLHGAGMLNDIPVRLSNTELHFREQGAALHTIVCIKNSNLGKLHSHALFFGTLCQLMQPQFCFQIDAGTTVTPAIALKLIRRLRERPELAAVAPRVMPAVPAADAGFLAHWQYTDFAARKGILWPFELATGHLSVIPGQTSVFRWRALRPAHAASVDQPAADDPLSGYLYGGDTLGCLDRIMYLAEDRVIGNQIVLAPGSKWKLGYAPDASAETDSCTGLAELLRQRRRWNNSEMATRWWLLRQLPNTLRRTDRGTAQNRHFALAVCAQALLAAREFLLPAQVIAILAVLLPRNPSPTGGWGASLSIAWLVSVGVWLLFEWFSPGRLSRILHWMCTGLFVATALLTVPLPGTLVLLAPALYLPNMSLVLPRSGLVSAGPARIFYLPHLVIAAALSCYSFWNLHDASWGTKGLKTTHAGAAGRSRLRRWRNRILCVWLVTNAAVAVAALRLPGLLSSRLNPVAELAAGVDVVIVAVSLWYLTRRLRKATDPDLPFSYDEA